MAGTRAPRGLVVAAPRSGSGKTTVTLGLLRALTRRGLNVAPLKCGPDYIDPAFHAAAAGRPSYNLDTWAMRRATLSAIATSAANDADLVIIEGVMGLFDGAAAEGQCGRGATADAARLLGLPVVLVIDPAGQTETAAAVALGCARYRSDVKVAGVILNAVASERHLSLIAPAVRDIGLEVFGAMLRNPALALPERHLGLVQAIETAGLDAHLDRLADAIETSIDLDAVIRAAAPFDGLHDCAGPAALPPPGQRIAIASDAAFSFLYPHVARGWRAAGAELVTFSPLADEAPDSAADAVWLPGGYPELHAGTLAAAERFKAGLGELAARGSTIHGECGGYMVLGNGLVDASGAHHQMAGLLAIETSFAVRRLNLGYRRARLEGTSTLGNAGCVLRGHEFHYATVLSNRDSPLAEITDASGKVTEEAGSRRGTVTGTFFHAIDVEDP